MFFFYYLVIVHTAFCRGHSDGLSDVDFLIPFYSTCST